MRYIIHPGMVHSKNDGDRHYISSHQLIELYGVNPKDCVVMNPFVEMRVHPKEGDVHLYPRYSGDYSLPKGSLTSHE